MYLPFVGTTEELDTVVEVVVHLHELDHGARTRALEGNTVELVLGVHVGARVLDDHVAQGA
jgi:hypothetical protein